MAGLRAPDPRQEASPCTRSPFRDMEDFSPAPPARKSGPRKLDPCKPVIRQWMQDDARNRRKQHHTVRGIRRRLVDECGADVSEATVGRCVAKLKRQRGFCSRR